MTLPPTFRGGPDSPVGCVGEKGMVREDFPETVASEQRQPDASWEGHVWRWDGQLGDGLHGFERCSAGRALQ